MILFITTQRHHFMESVLSFHPQGSLETWLLLELEQGKRRTNVANPLCYTVRWH